VEQAAVRNVASPNARLLDARLANAKVPNVQSSAVRLLIFTRLLPANAVDVNLRS
jgi:hypothetical protein